MNMWYQWLHRYAQSFAKQRKASKQVNSFGMTETHHKGELAQASHITALKTIEDVERADFVSLRTVPVVLKNGRCKVVVNALLDDGRTKTYVNSDVAAELGLNEISQKVTVNKLNGQAEKLVTTPVELQLESINGEFGIQIEAFTVKRVQET